MKIFIIGGTGVLSSDIVAECLSHGDTLYVLNRGRNKSCINDSKKFHQIVCDIRNKEEVKRKIIGMSFDVVVDFLSFSPDQLNQTFNIFAPICKQYIFISSCCVFRRSHDDGVITEQSYKPNTLLSYGLNKYNCEEELKLSLDANRKNIVKKTFFYLGWRIKQM